MRTLIAGITMVLAGCAGGPTAGVEAELATERAAWEARGLENYDLDLRYASAWFPPLTVRIEVRNGLATTARDLAADTLFTSLTGRQTFTVDSLFVTAAQWISQPGFNVELRFHPALSYPTTLYLDNPGWADEEQYFDVVRLVAR